VGASFLFCSTPLPAYHHRSTFPLRFVLPVRSTTITALPRSPLPVLPASCDFSVDYRCSTALPRFLRYVVVVHFVAFTVSSLRYVSPFTLRCSCCVLHRSVSPLFCGLTTTCSRSPAPFLPTVSTVFYLCSLCHHLRSFYRSATGWVSAPACLPATTTTPFLHRFLVLLRFVLPACLCSTVLGSGWYHSLYTHTFCSWSFLVFYLNFCVLQITWSATCHLLRSAFVLPFVP